MADDQRLAQLKDIVSIYLPEDVSVEAIGKDSSFVNELNINSANLVDIVLDVEDTFGIRLENEDMDKMQTVRDALNIIDQKLQDKK
ncbi:phosphopantetheine-binding protein [Arenibacter sp. F20364]|uniref:acyl carrier protein n=1 Tax=Arenibacter sp. F20364 TaxID=2926415 RepID=UPI001FF5470E|nr:phosphopantetheine-binding protein [Arenibacter sp. F20364]MCK0189242.1 phosphopantetheine-binding protein [Arenibacter sp. F20364]